MIAQDLGDYRAAEHLTSRAELHLRSASPELRAMVWMRKSNIIARSDPDMAVELAADAARLIDGHEVGRLAASIARQRALAALANRDTRGFLRHAAHALEMGDIAPADEDTAVYANAGFVASEIATGYLRIEEFDKAIELLQRHHGTWTSHQHRDRAVADTRLLQACIAAHEYRIADTLSDTTITGYLAAPSERARNHRRQSANLLRDRRRHDKNPLLQTLAGRIKRATQGELP
ncbi:hypothetical protein [Mycobacteroides chelonae]|uniref:hypothetical protein n=1 Tax=Mycobacteroides chelonae TaxID=1774 RepID=UPI001E4ABE1E|nr:hypothetical protein [Mycobacteroides chelonae]